MLLLNMTIGAIFQQLLAAWFITARRSRALFCVFPVFSTKMKIECGLHTWETISSFWNSFPNERYNWSCSSLAPTIQWGFSLTLQLQNLLANISLIFPHSLQALRWVSMSCYSCSFTDSVPCKNIPDGFVLFIIQISLSFHLVTFLQFFRPWYESFPSWRSSDGMEQELCYITDTTVIWIIVIALGLTFVYIKHCRKVLQKKLSK